MRTEDSDDVVENLDALNNNAVEAENIFDDINMNFLHSSTGHCLAQNNIRTEMKSREKTC